MPYYRLHGRYDGTTSKAMTLLSLKSLHLTQVLSSLIASRCARLSRRALVHELSHITLAGNHEKANRSMRLPSGLSDHSFSRRWFGRWSRFATVIEASRGSFNPFRSEVIEILRVIYVLGISGQDDGYIFHSAITEGTS